MNRSLRGLRERQRITITTEANDGNNGPAAFRHRKELRKRELEVTDIGTMRHMRSPLLAWIALLLAARTSIAETVVVSPGANVQFELQSRLIESMPGDVIQLEPGRYEFRGELNLVCRHVTIRGAGPEKTILSFRDQQAGNDGLLVTGDGFVVEDLAIENTAGNAIKVLGADGVTFRRVRVEWTEGSKSTNGAYGFYPVQCRNVLIEECVAIAAADAGIYVGQCQNVIVRRNRAERNVAGIEIENTLDADVYDNVATDNTGGIMVFDLPGLPVTNGGRTRVYNNRIEKNNHVNFAPKGNMVADVPQGTGMMLLAANQVEVFDNDIVDHDTANVLIVSFLSTQRAVRDPKYDPYSEGLFIHDNRIARGGTSPHGKLGETVAPFVGKQLADIVTDGMEDPKKHRNGRLPEELTLRLTSNGDVTFLNLNLANLTPQNLIGGRYKFEHDLAKVTGKLPALSPVTLSPRAPVEGDNPAATVYRNAPRMLSEWKLFAVDERGVRPAAGQVPYELNTPLFSDYTAKHRLIRLPEGTKITYRPEGVLEFPVGTVIAKTFAMPGELSQSERPERLLETRIQIRNETGWYGYSYVWDDAQRDARLSLGGGMCDVSWKASDGHARTNRYEIPNANQCLTCHSDHGVFAPLGPTAANLNRTIPSGTANQLEEWRRQGVLEGLPAVATVPRMPQFDDPATGTVDERARAWLDVNCAHCHRPAGSAGSSGLDLRSLQTDAARFGVLKTPVAAGKGSGGRKYDITPGKPDESILLFRMESTQPGIRMPNLSRNLVQDDAVKLVREWIAGMAVGE